MSGQETEENQRLAALHRLSILDTSPEARFDRLTQIAQAHYKTPVALFTLVDAERQWFKSCIGFAQSETDRSVAFCDHAIRGDDPFVVGDAARDPGFADNPLVTGPPHIRFYAGMPVRDPDGFKIGTLCIIDVHPRDPAHIDLFVLRELARIAEDELLLRPHATDPDPASWDVRLNRAIRRAQQALQTHATKHAAFEAILDDLLDLSEAHFGFIGEIFADLQQKPYMRVAAISDLSWNRATADFDRGAGTDDMRVETLDNLMGASLNADRVLITNDVTAAPRSGGQPPDHPPLDNYMGLPVRAAERHIGLVGLANRADGFDHALADRLDPLVRTIGTLLERDRLYREKQETHRRMRRLSRYDTLTGLPNRRHLSTLLENALTACRKRKDGALSICFIDLDDFKRINDQYGRPLGDAVLRAAADRIERAVAGQGFVARTGGDEFVAVLQDVRAEHTYGQLLEAIRQPLHCDGTRINVTASMGVTVFPDDDSEFDQLLRHADQAMYSAKEHGKHRYALFDLAGHSSRQERVRVLEQIERAIAEDELVLYYQPKIDLADGRVDGFEALIRWQHPEEGLLSPAHFIDHIEYTEYAERIGRLVLQRAVEQLAAFDTRGLDFSLSVNLSPSHFLGGTFVADLGRAIADYPPEFRRRLTLELLETTALDDSDAVIGALSQCSDVGVSIALDDFGTGYASLDYFRRLPADEIKIDRSFLRDLLNSPEDEALVRAMISLAHSFNRRVVAEGVEDWATHQRLIALGCDLSQGFLYSRPQPIEEALAWAEDFKPSRSLAFAGRKH